jgi:hypothetical protein
MKQIMGGSTISITESFIEKYGATNSDRGLIIPTVKEAQAIC